MLFANGDAVTVSRNGVAVSSFAGGFDPSQNAVYGPYSADVQEGDVLAFRGLVRRVLSFPERWRNPFTGWEAGTVCKVDPAPAFMPDLGSLSRKVSDEAWVDEALVPAVWETVWSGAVHVKPAEGEGEQAAVAEQQVGVVSFVVDAPLTLEDVRPEDRLTVLSSRDGRLETVTLNVTHVLAGSSELTRRFRAIENQG